MRRRQNVVWCVTVFGWFSLAACDNSTPRQPTLASAATPAPSAPTPAPSTPTLAGFRLSGVVLEGTPSGLRPVPGGGSSSGLRAVSGGRVGVDTSGRYTISGLPAGRLVRVTWSSLCGGCWAAPAMPSECHDSGRHRAGHRGCSTGFSRVHLWFAHIVRRGL